MAKFKIGDRVVVNDRAIKEGIYRKDHQRDRVGTVTGVGKIYTSSIKVRWDGNKSSGGVHENFLRLTESQLRKYGED